MRRLRPPVILMIAFLLVGLQGCVEVRDRYEHALGSADEASHQIRFCLSLTRAVNAVESGSPDIAEDAIEEAVTQAPEQVSAEVRSLAERIRAAEDAGSDAFRDPELVTEARALRERVRELCDPV